VDRQVTEESARLHARTPVPPIDGLLAATALVKGLTLVTRYLSNIARTDVPCLNPFQPRPKEELLR
jgi:predicted nucleic acid-binding protein